jgi:peptidase E
LTKKIWNNLSNIKGLTIYGNPKNTNSIVSFNIDGINPHDISKILDETGNICVRSGFHCAIPGIKHLNVSGTVRASVHYYNNMSDVEKLANFTEEIAKNIKMDLIENEALAFISSSPSGFEKSDFYFNINIRWFNRIGVEFDNYYLLDNRTKNNKAKDYIKQSSCIFLMGGNTEEQIKYIRESNYLELLPKHEGIIMGISAGAINLASKSLFFGYSKGQETNISNGVGITEKTIFPHFRINDEEKINELKKFSNNFTIYGMCDYSAIIERKNEVKMVGEIYKINNSIVEKISP